MQTTMAENSKTDVSNMDLTLQKKLHDVENLTKDLKRLLVNHEVTLDEEGVRNEVELLERWMESYRRGLSAAGKISESGVQWLYNLRDHLKLAAEERQRLEAEGGSALNREQIKETDDLLEAALHIDKAIPDLKQMLSPSHADEHA